MFPRTEMLDLIVVDGRARGIVTRDLVTGEVDHAPGRRRRARHRRIRQRLLSLHQRQGVQRHRHLAGAQARRRVRQSLLHPDPPDLHSGERRLPVEAHPDERVAPQRRPRLGAEAEGRHAAAARDPGERAGLLPRAEVSRASATSRRATSPRAPRRRPATRAAASGPAGSASTSILPTRSSGWASRRSGSATAISSRCTSASPTRTRTGADAHLSRPSTTRWAGSGWTTT